MLRRALTVVAFLAGFSHLGWAASSNNEFLAHLVGHLYRQGESFACLCWEPVCFLLRAGLLVLNVEIK